MRENKKIYRVCYRLDVYFTTYRYFLLDLLSKRLNRVISYSKFALAFWIIMVKKPKIRDLLLAEMLEVLKEIA